MHNRTGLCALCLVLLGCGGGSSGSPVENQIGPAGGALTADDGTTIQVPAGALTEEVTLTMTATGDDVPAAAGTVAVGQAYLFGPEGQLFAVPVDVTLPFSASRLPNGTSANDVVVLTAPASGSESSSLGGTPVDASHVAAQTSHFSRFQAVVLSSEEVADATPADGATLADASSYDAPTGPAPTVANVSPGSARTGGGTAIVITGTNFLPGPTVTIGGTAATSVERVSSTSITAVAPAHTQGVFDVVVTNPDGQLGTLTNGLQFYGGTCAPAGETSCTDGADNDTDGYTDCGDFNCNCCDSCGCYPVT